MMFVDTLSKMTTINNVKFFTVGEKEQKTQNNATTPTNTDHVWNWFGERMFRDKALSMMCS